MMQRRGPRGATPRIRWRLVAAGLGFALVSAAGAAAPRPGPAPIVVSGSGSEPVRVSQGGKVRIVDPDAARGRVTTRAASDDDSAFDVPEPEDESFEAEEFDQGYQPEEIPYGGEPQPDRGGYESSSTLNQRLPGASSDPFAKGYAPSSSLDERMAVQAASQMNAWPAADLTDPGAVQQWSDRGSQSRGGTP